jgi:pSer/pThr/pTyr-binding forkhead associated (FHA) protein
VRHEAQLIPLGSHAGTPPIPIKRPTTLIGSRQDIVRLHLQSSTVSKAHAVIVLNRWGCYIHDLSSRTKTWVNGKDVVEADLRDGDLIQIGRFKFKYVAPKNAASRDVGDEPVGELSVSTQSEALPLRKRVIQIGRRAGGDVELDDKAVSNTHAILFRRNGALYVRDLSSRTGTFKDGMPVHEDRLDDGQTLKIGAATLTYRGPAAAEINRPAGAADSFDALPGAAAAVSLAGPPSDSSDSIAASAPSIDAVRDDDLAELDLATEPASPAADIDAEIDAMLGVEPAADDLDESAPGEGGDAMAALRRGWRGKTPGDEPAGENAGTAAGRLAPEAPDDPIELATPPRRQQANRPRHPSSRGRPPRPPWRSRSISTNPRHPRSPAGSRRATTRSTSPTTSTSRPACRRRAQRRRGRTRSRPTRSTSISTSPNPKKPPTTPP